MKIDSLTVEGFRSLKHIEWKPGDLNVIIGPNASGKSNLLSALELISASAKGKLRDSIVAAGGMEAALWNTQAQHIFADFSTSPTKLPEGYVNYNYAVGIERYGNTNNFEIGLEHLRSHLINLTHEQIEATEVNRSRSSGTALFDGKIERTFSGAELNAEETLLSRLELTGSPFIPVFKQYLTSWAIYNDVYTHREAAIRQSAVTRYEKQVMPDGQNLATVLHTLYTNEREFRNEVDLGMRAAFGEEYEEIVFLPAATQRIELGVQWKSLKRPRTAADLSDGTLRFLFLLTVLANPAPPSLIAIDEPETGLHPEMLPLVAEFAIEAARHTQVVLTTHSNLFLSAFRDKRPTVTVISSEAGETKLAVADDTRLEYWLKDYSLGKLYESRQLETMV